MERGTPGVQVLRANEAHLDCHTAALTKIGDLERPRPMPPKKIDFCYKILVFDVVWAGFEVGFGISVKNHADP